METIEHPYSQLKWRAIFANWLVPDQWVESEQDLIADPNYFARQLSFSKQFEKQHDLESRIFHESRFGQ